MYDYTPKDIERFWKYVDKSKGENECWLWTAAKNRRGYGRFRFDYTHIPAHRFSYYLEHGFIGEGLFICHHCDNPTCCNPKHLFAGTAKDNSQDRERKGRGSKQKGDNAPNKKLSMEKARMIRQEYARGDITQMELARKYGVSEMAINRTVKGFTWIETD